MSGVVPGRRSILDLAPNRFGPVPNRTRTIREMSEKKLAIFLSRIDKRDPDECWEWQGTKANGYGNFSILRCESYYLSHRIAFKLHTGIDPVGKVVCHSCDNPACCNPAHLWLGTPQDNMADMKAKNRVRQTPKTCTRCGTDRSTDYVYYSVYDGRQRRACRGCSKARQSNQSARQALTAYRERGV